MLTLRWTGITVSKTTTQLIKSSFFIASRAMSTSLWRHVHCVRREREGKWKINPKYDRPTKPIRGEHFIGPKFNHGVIMPNGDVIEFLGKFRNHKFCDFWRDHEAKWEKKQKALERTERLKQGVEVHIPLSERINLSAIELDAKKKKDRDDIKRAQQFEINQMKEEKEEEMKAKNEAVRKMTLQPLAERLSMRLTHRDQHRQKRHRFSARRPGSSAETSEMPHIYDL